MKSKDIGVMATVSTCSLDVSKIDTSCRPNREVFYKGIPVTVYLKGTNEKRTVYL